MAPSEILTFSAPQAQTPQVEAMPSPTLELAYAYYALARQDSPQRTSELPWLGMLYRQHPDLVDSIKTFWPGVLTDSSDVPDLLLLAVCSLGYARDPDLQRLFTEFGSLPKRAAAYLESARGEIFEHDHYHKEERKYGNLIEHFAALQDSGPRKRFLALLKQLWKLLGPIWDQEGRLQAERASQEFTARYRETGDVLRALPAHHFVQFEDDRQRIRKSLEKNKLLVTPLFFATGGGFNFDFADAHYIGYGIQSERYFETLTARVAVAANRIKAVADPTRLMLLALISRYTGFDMTVSDFAAQLGVTQPTVSGHLKLLKDADLVTMKKKGNKAIYKVNTAALEEAIGEFQTLVLKNDK